MENLPTHSNTLRPTQGRVGQGKIRKLACEHASEMSLANDSKQPPVGRAHEEPPARDLSHPKLCGASGSGLLRIGIIKCPSNYQGYKHVSCI